MANKVWNGKTAAEWLAVLNEGDVSQRETALFNLEQMVVYAYATGEKTHFQIAKAAAAQTHSRSLAIRIRAYGVVGVLTRFFAFDLLKGDELKKRKACVSLLAMIRESNRLHADLVRIAPNLADEMVGKPSTTKEIFDGLIEKLSDERDQARGNDRREIDAAVAHVKKVRDKR